MPLYEYYCTKCASKYELLRTMAHSDDPATCPSGHKGGARTLSMFASVKSGGGGFQDDSSGAGAGAGGGGCGCGGGGCGCGGH